jgi:hypothetical protein
LSSAFGSTFFPSTFGGAFLSASGAFLASCGFLAAGLAGSAFFWEKYSNL